MGIIRLCFSFSTKGKSKTYIQEAKEICNNLQNTYRSSLGLAFTLKKKNNWNFIQKTNSFKKVEVIIISWFIIVHYDIVIWNNEIIHVRNIW